MLFLLCFVNNFSFALGKLHLVLPAFNEEHRLSPLSFKQHLDSHPSTEFLFVNDGSTDGTLLILESLREQSTSIDVLDLQQNVGKAEATRQGLLRALTKSQDGDFVGFWDSDLATPLSEIDKFMGIFEEQPAVDMVFGARVALLGRHIERRAERHYIGRVHATLASALLRMPIYDTQCGAKIFRANRELRLALSSSRFVAGWIFDVELLARLQIIGHNLNSPPLQERIYELPLTRWVDISGSKVRWTDKAKGLWWLMRIWIMYYNPLVTNSSWCPPELAPCHKTERPMAAVAVAALCVGLALTLAGVLLVIPFLWKVALGPSGAKIEKGD